MYKHNECQMILPEEFCLPFAGKLNPKNRWCQLALIIPWDANEQLGYDCDRGNNLTYILEINCFIICSRLNVLFTYSKNKFSKSTVELFGNNYINNLKSIIKHCCGKESVEYTPSDFDAIDISQKELDSLFTD
ncbi:MAG: hypothetical protein MI740_13560 [Halanaerobiales bacterium]|nr:hypothetical protein [Halanaerobiales bacterium]